MSNKKNSVEYVLKLINGFTLSELTNLQLEQSRILQQRTNDFMLAIINSDINKLKELFELEVNFKDSDFWKKLSKVNLSHTTKETIDYLMNLEMDAKFISGSIFSNNTEFRRITDVTQDNPVNRIEMLQKFIRERLEKSLMYSEFSEVGFNVARTYFESNKFFVLSQHAIKNFARFESIDGYESIHDYIKENESILAPILFNNIKTEENLESFVNNQKYKNFLENGIKVNGSETLMANAISDAAFAKISILHKIGIRFPDSKPPYSNLFQKTIMPSIPSQRYVLKNIEDITFGDQIILRTLLHSSNNGAKECLIKEVLERYAQQCTAEQIAELIPEAIINRELKQEVLLVKKFGEYYTLKNEIGEKSNDYPLEKKRVKI